MASTLHHSATSARRTTHFPGHRPVCPRGTPLLAAAVRLLIQLFKLIRDIGITHGNETQVGYYVGLLVRIRDLSLHSRFSCLFFNPVAFAILRDASAHCAALEPSIGPYRPKTCHLDGLVWLVHFNVLLWSIQDLLGIGIEVTRCLLSLVFVTADGFHVHLAVP